MTEKRAEYQITFMPDNVSVMAEEGTNLLEAARGAGIDIGSPCGGNGTCGKCAVKILSGRWQARNDFHLTEGLKSAGYVLSCTVRVEDSLTVEVPAQSRMTKQKVVLSEKHSGESEYFARHKMNPVCRKYHLTLAKPDLTDSMNDLDRVRTALKKDYDITGTSISLSCLRALPGVIRQGDFEITVTVVKHNGSCGIISVEPGRSEKPAYGAAVDIGTTTVVVVLLDAETGRIVDQEGSYNKQASCGSDVISRIIYGDETAGGLEFLQNAAAETVNGLLETILKRNGLEPEDISAMVCGGNTVMTHLFMGVAPSWLRLEPYVPAAVKFPAVKASEIGVGIHPDAPVITIPSVASYVGGDVTAGVFAIVPKDSDDLTLFIDIGTNGELVLGNREWLVTCSCSAGPAFEGSGISSGMRAMDGAIDWIEIEPDSLETNYRVIGGEKPLGVCGSGLIYSLSEMLEAGIIDRAGKILTSKESKRVRLGAEGPEYLLADGSESATGSDIVITEGDVKNLLRAKGAIFAGIRTMLQQVQLDIGDICNVYIAGGFGKYINITDAVRIGLLPDLPEDKYEYVGNSCIQGAAIGLLSLEALAEMEELAGRMTYLELSIGNQFMDEFISAVFIPHTDLSLFPSLQ
ncbi:MAG TPA: ASKHA domain-containing protein [Anaerovoracaceae bacterium]|nr:ASKHA domain-containing protein [Anaerovoracaceae bacterium]